MNKFIVINAKTGPARCPQVHTTFDSAQREADRIASLDPGAKVYVLRAIGYMQKRDVKWEGNWPDRRDLNQYDCLSHEEGLNAKASDDQIPF